MAEMANNTLNSQAIQNNDITSSILTSFVKSLWVHQSKVFCDELGETIGTIISNNVRAVSDDTSLFYLFTTSYASRARAVTSKFLRITSEKIVIGNCSDTESLNYVQQNFICINQGSYEAMVFRASNAFLYGITSTLIFTSNPLFAVFDGINAALYDATDELKKVAKQTQNQELQVFAEIIITNKGFLFEGLNGYLKVSNKPIKFAQEYYGFLKGAFGDKFATTLDKMLFLDLINKNPIPNLNIVNNTKVEPLLGIVDVADEL